MENSTIATPQSAETTATAFGGRRKFSFYALVATVIAVGLLFYRVAQPFLLPIFIAGMLAVIFRPVHLRCTKWFGQRRHLSAGIVTATVLLLVLLPVVFGVAHAAEELFAAARTLLETDWRSHVGVERILTWVDDYVPIPDREQWESSIVDGLKILVTETYDRSRALLANVIEFLIGLVIVALGLFYFLAEGPALLKALQRVSPLDDRDELIMFEEFDRVCRGVIVASGACAVAQGFLAFIGFAVLRIDGALLLAGLTICVSFVPLLGAALVWAGVCISLLINGDFGTAIALATYGALVVSTSDNLIRAYLIRGTVGMHPFVAFVSVVGAIRVVGIWGIFLGPIVAAFFYALLKILHQQTHPDMVIETAANSDGVEAVKPLRP